MMPWGDTNREDSPPQYQGRTYISIPDDIKIEKETTDEESEKELIERANGSMDSEGEENICRYCLDPGGELIAPCVCKGGQKWVHLDCLRKWQRMVLVKKSTHPYFHEREPNRHEICNVCNAKFLIKPMNYAEMVIALTGQDIVDRINEGFIIVRTVESSEQSRRILASNHHISSVRRNLTPWIGGAYLIVGISADASKPQERGEDLICAINLTNELPRIETRRVRFCDGVVGPIRHVSIRHFDGGPCDGLHALTCLKYITRENAEEAGVQIMAEKRSSVVVSGKFETIVELADMDWWYENERRGDCSRPQPVLPNREVLLAWGDGTWSRTQLIGEIARGGWGMCRFRVNDVFEIPGESAPPPPECLFRKIHRQNRVLAPGQNEMSRAMNESIDIRPFEQNEQLARHREFLRAQLLARNQRPPDGDTTMMMSIDSPMGSTAPNSISSNTFMMEENTQGLPNIEISSPAIPALSSMATRSTSLRSSYLRRRRSENEGALRGRRRQRRRTGEQQEDFHMES
jgi:hypothetical protein